MSRILIRLCRQITVRVVRIEGGLKIHWTERRALSFLSMVTNSLISGLDKGMMKNNEMSRVL